MTEEYTAVLDESELEDNSMRLVKVEGIPVLLVKTNGKVFAIDNRCPHMGCMFSGGSLDGYVIVCPCHDWRFDLRTGESEDHKEITLTKFKLKKKSSKLWVKVEI